jgi:hypothetical protein
MKVCVCCKILKPLNDFGKCKIFEDGRNYYCLECNKTKAREWRKRNPEKAKLGPKKWVENNREKRREIDRKRRAKNPERMKELRRKWHQTLMSNPRNRVCNRISTGMQQTLKGRKNGRKWQEIVGYTTEQLMKHLETQFLPGMSWENMGEWHIDHIIPISAFNFSNTDDIDFSRCWAMKNLRPLWRKENQIKKDKVEIPHQPSLAMAL